MRVEILTPSLISYYENYIRGKEHCLFYYSTKYKNFLKKLLNCEEEYLLAVEGLNEIRGILPLMYIEVGELRIYNSLPYYGSNGGIVADNKEAYTKLLKAYNEIACNTKTLSSTVIQNPFLRQDSIDYVYNFQDSRIAQITNISLEGEKDSKEFLERVDPSARRNIKKAIREGIKIELDHTQLNRLREIHQANILALGGIPKSNTFFDLIPHYFSPNEDYDLYVAKKDDTIIAGLLVFYFGKTVEYFTPAIDSQFRTYQPLSLLIITAIKEAAQKGFKWWNWGGTWESQKGVYKFKKKWGAADFKYFYYTQLNDLSILNWSQDKILKSFQNFFVVPFKYLERNKEGK